MLTPPTCRRAVYASPQMAGARHEPQQYRHLPSDQQRCAIRTTVSSRVNSDELCVGGWSKHPRTKAGELFFFFSSRPTGKATHREKSGANRIYFTRNLDPLRHSATFALLVACANTGTANEYRPVSHEKSNRAPSPTPSSLPHSFFLMPAPKRTALYQLPHQRQESVLSSCARTYVSARLR